MTASLPDVVTNPDAVLGDKAAKWRFGFPPSYTKTREFYDNTKTMSHEQGSLPNIVENLVKNWEIEASFKTDLSDWRTIDQSCYTFSLNGGPKNSGEVMTQVGTYNALLSKSALYDPEHNDFTASHKTFKRMMPVFAWEVLEVYSGPPNVAFRWRHWGEMKNDYVGFNKDGRKVRVKAHGGTIEVQGMLVATVNDGLQIQSIDVWYDPMAMFDSITRNGQDVVVEDVKPGDADSGSESEGRCPVTGAVGPAH